MAVIKITEHRKRDGGCGKRWIYTGTKTDNICCYGCGKRFDLNAKDKKLLKKIEKMNEREKG